MCNEHELGLMTGTFDASLFQLDVLSMMEHAKVVAACMHRLCARWHVMTRVHRWGLVDTDGNSWRLDALLHGHARLCPLGREQSRFSPCRRLASIAKVHLDVCTFVGCMQVQSILLHPQQLPFAVLIDNLYDIKVRAARNTCL